MFGQIHYLHLLFAYTKSKGSDKTARIRRHVWSLADEIWNKCQKSHEQAHFLTTLPFVNYQQYNVDSTFLLLLFFDVHVFSSAWDFGAYQIYA